MFIKLYSPKNKNTFKQKVKFNDPIKYFINKTTRRNKEIKERLFYRMCQIFPKNSFKSFVLKFITTSDDIFVFRKQFTTSYGLNSILVF